MTKVDLYGDKLNDVEAFHYASRGAFGFPDFYGMNINAWIDSLTALDEDDGMSNILLAPNEHLIIVLHHSDTVRIHAPDVIDSLIVGCASVNQRQHDSQKTNRIAIVFL